MRLRLKWLAPIVFVLAGVFLVIIAPAAVENMLPEVQTVFPEKHEYCATVRSAGIIYGSQSGGFYLRAAVRERDINRVEAGQGARLYGAAIGDGEYTATVSEIARSARQQEVFGVPETVVDVVLQIETTDDSDELDDSKTLMRAGYTAEALIEVEEPRDILLIPYAAIAQDDIGEYVLMLTGNTAIRKDIVTGIELANGTEPLSGVSEDDELILNPEDYGENALVKKDVKKAQK